LLPVRSSQLPPGCSARQVSPSPLPTTSLQALRPSASASTWPALPTLLPSAIPSANSHNLHTGSSALPAPPAPLLCSPRRSALSLRPTLQFTIRRFVCDASPAPAHALARSALSASLSSLAPCSNLILDSPLLSSNSSPLLLCAIVRFLSDPPW